MSRRLQALTLLAGAALAAACVDSRDSTPTSPEFQLTGPSCSPTNIKKYAKALAGTTSQLYKYAQQFTSQNANSTFATNLFFDLAAEAANLARPGTLPTDKKTALANLLIQGIACANVEISDVNYSGLNYVNQFYMAAGATGMLEVRGRNSGENANIYSHQFGQDVSQHGLAGVKPPTAGFREWYGGTAMFYGFPISSFSAELPPASEGVALEVAFEVFTVRPAGKQLSSTLRGSAALCVVGDVLAPEQFRIQRAATILPVSTNFPEFPCPGPLSSRVDQDKSALGSAFAWLRRNLLPQPLSATSFLLYTKPTSSPKALSPLEAINPLGATLTYAPAPASGIIGSPLGVKVHAAGAAGTAWEGLLIKIIAQDNNGRFVAVSPDMATTDSLGLADFSTSTINKAGVYQLLAVTLPGPDVDATGFAQDSVLSGNFLQTPK